MKYPNRVDTDINYKMEEQFTQRRAAMIRFRVEQRSK